MSSKKGQAAGHKPDSIKNLRHQIDRLDREILKVANQRAALASRIGEVKNESGLEIYSPGREEEILTSVLEGHHGPLHVDCVRAIFRELMSGSRALQKVLRVAYLGPEYSFSHLAAIEKFGQSVEFVPVGSIQAVFEEVNRGHVDFGLVPVENSTDGRISDTLEMFTRLPLRICAEARLKIHHNLLSKGPQSDVRRVYSREQALSQCRTWLSKHGAQAQLISVASPATAAELATREPHAAAVASRQAGAHYGLQTIASNIEDVENNATRFAVIGENPSPRTGKDKTAIMFQIPHKPGSLSDSLMVFKKNRVNLTWIESFPSREAEQEYLFFIDFEGHPTESRIKRTLAALERRSERLVILGSYPISDCYDA